MYSNFGINNTVALIEFTKSIPTILSFPDIAALTVKLKVKAIALMLLLVLGGALSLGTGFFFQTCLHLRT